MSEPSDRPTGRECEDCGTEHARHRCGARPEGHVSVTELRELLSRRAVPAGAVTIEDGDVDETYVLDREGDAWTVYYSERGVRTEERRFDSESDACEELVRRLRRDFSFDV